MGRQSEQFKERLRDALMPVDPPDDLETDLAIRLHSLVGSVADELESWELSAMKNPRSWVRPIAATMIGGGAAVGLVVLRAQKLCEHRRRAKSKTPWGLTKHALNDARNETRNVRQQLTRNRKRKKKR